MLLRFDPFRDLDREFDRAFGRAVDRTTVSPMPMDAVRRGNHVVVDVDLPGVGSDDVDLTVERNVLTVTAERSADRAEDDEVLASERRHGRFSRQFFLGETLDAGQVEAELRDGVLRLRIPVAEMAKPRKVEVRAGAHDDTAEITA